MGFVFENNDLVGHRIWFKNILNPIFRLLQFWTNQPYVIVTRVKEKKVIGYGFKRMTKLLSVFKLRKRYKI